MMVKICGITRREDAEAAAEAGASALGFIFYPKSTRYVTPEQALKLGDGLAPWKVGVFVDESLESIATIMTEAMLDVAQIYGGNDISMPTTRWWKATRLAAHGGFAVCPSRCEALFLDGSTNGVCFDWSVVPRIAKFSRHWSRPESEPQPLIIIAGGLNSSNVAEAIRIAHPWGVDASSGLELSPGIKDHEKVRQFIKAAREASQ